jgi:hypothetical protein
MSVTVTLIFERALRPPPSLTLKYKEMFIEKRTIRMTMPERNSGYMKL